MLNKKKNENLLNFVIFKELQEKSAFLKIAAQAFEAGDFLNIFFRFLGFWGSFSYKNFSLKKVNKSVNKLRVIRQT